MVRGDPTRLNQILVNLVGNGLKFTHRGGVTLAVRELPAPAGGVRLRFEVQDTGIGIALDRQAELFQPFVQADSSTARRYGGSGLGLAICQRLVVAMGGVIGLTSEPGRGSLFWFELPFERGRAATANDEPIEPARVSPLRLLVVDDVPINRELLSEVLGRQGHEVLLAGDGADALDLAGRVDLDVVLMDVQMPVMDGIEATRRIRQLPGPQATVPIFALSASMVASERQRYLAAGMNLCLSKPIVWTELFAALAEVAQSERPGGAFTAPAQHASSVDEFPPGRFRLNVPLPE